MRLEPEFIRNLMRERSPAAAYVTALLGPRERSGTRALFAFVSICRDAIDFAGSRKEAQSSVALLKRMFDEGVVQRVADEHSIVDDVIQAVPDFGLAWEAWSFLHEDFEVPRAYAIEFIAGLKQDAEGYRPETVEDLLRYVYRTGGVLGLIACHIFAADGSMQQPAVDAASAARLSSLADNVYKDFTLGRCQLPLEWANYATTQTFAPSWADVGSRRFRQIANILESSSRSGFAHLSFRNRTAIVAMSVLHRESRSPLMRKLDRTADQLLRLCAESLWSTFAHLLRQFQTGAQKFAYAIADVIEQRTLKPVFDLRREDLPKLKSLPSRDLATSLRNQKIRIDRSL